MSHQPDWHALNQNPLTDEAPGVWQRLIEQVGPASLLVLIESRMNPALRRQVPPEDILQETLLHAWRDRARFTWHGLRSFRAWLVTIIENRIRDAAAYLGAQKRGGDQPTVMFSALKRGASTSAEGTGSDVPPAIASTTPSRLAVLKEEASAMNEALEGLSPDLRDVVRFRLFEQLPLEEIAGRLGIGVSAVRHRFRKGAAAYRQRLLATFSSRARRHGTENSDASAANASFPDRELPEEAARREPQE